MELQDKSLVCRDCSKEFTFTASEQEFYKSKGFENEPTRCADCRAKRKSGSMSNRRGGSGAGGERQLFTVNCSDCGKETQVPFKPVQEKPVYCRDCYQNKKSR